MTSRFPTPIALAALTLVALLAVACNPTSAAQDDPLASRPAAAAAAEQPEAPPRPLPASDGTAATGGSDLTFDGSRAELERFIGYYKSIPLTAEQERVKVEALAAIPAPCCADNPLATCCCPCNMAKAAWGMAAWLITEKDYGAEQVRSAAESWLAAANPDGFTGDACYTGGCNRPVHRNGCGGMDDRQVL